MSPKFKVAENLNDHFLKAVVRKINVLYSISAFWIIDHAYLLSNITKLGSGLCICSVERL